MTAFTDSHAHLSELAGPAGAPGLEALFAAYGEAWARGSEGPAGSQGAAGAPGMARPLIVDIGVDPGDLSARLARLGRRPFLRYSLGVWPGEAVLASQEALGGALRALEADLGSAPGLGVEPCAIGECGLDYHYGEDRAAQARLFAAQIAIARREGLPLIVHSREAFADTLAMLRCEAGGLEVVIHCFGYGPDEAQAFLDEGYSISFAGNLTYKKAGPLRAACSLVPSGKLLLETDSPYMNPEPRRGKPSSPEDIVRTYECAASLRGCDVAVLAEAVSRNAMRLFGRS